MLLLDSGPKLDTNQMSSMSLIDNLSQVFSKLHGYTTSCKVISLSRTRWTVQLIIDPSLDPSELNMAFFLWIKRQRDISIANSR